MISAGPSITTEVIGTIMRGASPILTLADSRAHSWRLPCAFPNLHLAADDRDGGRLLRDGHIELSAENLDVRGWRRDDQCLAGVTPHDQAHRSLTEVHGRCSPGVHFEVRFLGHESHSPLAEGQECGRSLGR